MKNTFYAVFYEDHNELVDEMILSTASITKVRFTTTAPGGFAECSFDLRFNPLMVADLYRKLLGRHIILMDWMGDRAFEGRVEDMDIDGEKLSVTSLGYYANASDLTAGPSVFIATDTATTILAFMIDLCILWQDEYGFMAPDDNVYIGPKEYSRNEKISQVVQDILKYGYLDTLPDSSQRRRPIYLDVYEHRFVRTYPEPDIRTDEPNWRISIHSLSSKGGLQLKTSTKDVFNKIYVSYNDPNLDGQSYLSAKEDIESQDLYGIREGVISIGEADLSIAQVVQNLVVDYNSTPKAEATFEVVGNPTTNSGMVMPLHKIRAGDMIQIIDHDPATATLMGGQQGVSGSVAFVAETKYDADNHSCRLTLGSNADVLESLLIRLGVGTGGVS